MGSGAGRARTDSVAVALLGRGNHMGFSPKRERSRTGSPPEHRRGVGQHLGALSVLPARIWKEGPRRVI
jgi:hypothetical protein